MNPYIALFQFLDTLIDTQIKKYVKLATIGIGPDARINADLVVCEVDELLELSEALFNELEINLAIRPIDNPNFPPIFEQIKFYVEQEHTRAYAGWLLDENNIHTPVMSRVSEQLKELNHIAQAAGIESSKRAKPVTKVQKQCEYDSYAIAFYILDLVKRIQEPVSVELIDKIPEHALTIIRRNASIRYNQEEFSMPINQLHAECKEHLEHSKLEKSTSSLTSEHAHSCQTRHLHQLTSIRKRYSALQPLADMPIACEDTKPLATNNAVRAKPNTLFAPVVVSIVLVSMLLAYFLLLNKEHGLTHDFNIKP